MTSPLNVTNNVTSSPSRLTPLEDGSLRGLETQSPFSVVVLESLVFLTLWILALLGNILVVIVIHKSRRVQSTTNFFVASIALSDIVLVLLSGPFVCVSVAMQEWAAGQVMCKLVRYIQFFAMSTTSFVLVAICIDRYYTIIYPLSFKVTRGTAKRMIITAWLTSALMSSLCLYFFEQVAVNAFDPWSRKRQVCPTYIPAYHWSGVLYAILCITSQYLSPFILVLIGYCRVFCYVISKRNQARRSKKTNNPVPRTKVKMAEMLMILSIATFLLYLPYYLTHIIYCFGYRNFLSSDVFIASFWLVSASAALKPVIYACGNGNFWRGCKEVLCMSTMRCYRWNTYVVTNASAVSKKNYVGVLDLSKEQVGISIDSPIESFYKLSYNEKVSWPTHGSLPSTSL